MTVSGLDIDRYVDLFAHIQQIRKKCKMRHVLEITKIINKINDNLTSKLLLKPTFYNHGNKYIIIISKKIVFKLDHRYDHQKYIDNNKQEMKKLFKLVKKIILLKIHKITKFISS